MAKETASRHRRIDPQPVLAFAYRNKLPIIVFFVSFLIRSLYLLAYSHSPFFQVHLADALYHEEWAKRILGGDTFSLKMQGVFYKAPLYPYFIALSHLLSGNSNFVLMFLQVILAALSCSLLFLIGNRYFNASAAFIGALFYTLYFPSVYFSTEMEIPSVAIFLTLLSFYYLLLANRTTFWVISALVLGLSILALPTNILLLPLYVSILFKKQEVVKQGIKKAAVFALITFATISPCTLRNLIAGNHLTLVSANGGINFFIGNNDKYNETVYLQPGYAFEHFYNEPRRIGGAISFADQNHYWYKKALDFILAHPGRELLLVLKKSVLYLADYEIYRNTDIYYAKENSIYKSLPFIPFSLILATGLTGLFAAVRRGRSLDLLFFCVLQALPCIIFFVTDRYRLPSVCAWAIFSGFFVTSLADMIKGTSWRAGFVTLAGAVCVAIVSNLNFFVVKNPQYRPHFNLGSIYETQKRYDRALEEYSTALNYVKMTVPRDIKTESELYARLGNVNLISGNLDSARMSFDRAIAVNPNLGPAYSYLGSLYDKEKKSDLAIKMFNRAIEIDPWDVVSIHNLGLLYLNNMKFDEAITRFTRVIELAPEHSGAHNNLAYIYGAVGKYELMESEAKTAVYYNPREFSARYNLASLYLNTGRIEEAIEQYRAITQTTPIDSSNAYNQLGIIYAERGDLRQAVVNWQMSLEIDPNNTDALTNIGKAREMMREGMAK